MPIGLIVSLVVCIIVYVGVSAILTGITSYKNLDVADALSYGLNASGNYKIAIIVSLGSVIGILAVIFASNFATSQILSTMSKDGLLPKVFGKKSKKDVPVASLWIIGIIEAIFGGFLNINTLANFSSVAFLIVYAFVCFGLIMFRRKYPNFKSGFKVPFFPWLPLLGTIVCVFLLANLSLMTWVIFVVILVLIIISYFCYGKRHSKAKHYIHDLHLDEEE